MRRKRPKRQSPEHIERRRSALKRLWQKRRELFKEIALKHTPDTVLCIEILDRKPKEEEYEGIARANRGTMVVPRPSSIYKLWVFLHECFHIANFDPWRQLHNDEFRAEQFALKTIEGAGIEIPTWIVLRSMYYIKALIEKDEAEGLFIDPQAAEYAGYKPKPYVFDPEKDPYRELWAGPRISEAEAERIQAIREEYRKREGDA